MGGQDQVLVPLVAVGTHRGGHLRVGVEVGGSWPGAATAATRCKPLVDLREKGEDRPRHRLGKCAVGDQESRDLDAEDRLLALVAFIARPTEAGGTVERRVHTDEVPLLGVGEGDQPASTRGE